MGCLFGKPTEDEQCEVTLSNVTNAAVLCRGGAKGPAVTAVPTDKGYQVSGQGIFLGSCPLDCDIGRWEVIVDSDPGSVQIGLMRHRKTGDLSNTLLDHKDDAASPAWCLEHALKVGDVVGVYWDQTDLPMVSFTVNGTLLPQAAVSRIRPANDIYPAVSVSGSGKVTVVFDEGGFAHPPLHGKFKMIICSTSLI